MSALGCRATALAGLPPGSRFAKAAQLSYRETGRVLQLLRLHFPADPGSSREAGKIGEEFQVPSMFQLSTSRLQPIIRKYSRALVCLLA